MKKKLVTGVAIGLEVVDFLLHCFEYLCTMNQFTCIIPARAIAKSAT